MALIVSCLKGLNIKYKMHVVFLVSEVVKK